MKRWIIRVEWYEDRGMYETRVTAKDYHIRAEDEESAQEYAEALVSRVGGHDYDLMEG